MLTPDQISDFIEQDKNSLKKRLARKGLRYYEGDHDIRKYELYYFNAKGELVPDTTRSNIKIPHPFFTELVDQEVQYMLSGDEGFIKSDMPELQELLDEYFNENEDFTSELYEVLTGCVSKGFEYMYCYQGADDKLKFQAADSMGVVEVRARDTDDNTEYVIYWYVDRITEDNDKIKKIMVFDATNIYYYERVNDGEIVLDTDQELNPRPHVVYTDDKGDRYGSGFGFIPFFRLDNNRKQFSGLKPIKDLIDDYDLMSCGLSNNLQDVSEALYVVSGFQGDNLEELITNIKTKKHIGVDENGSVDIKTIDVPYQARQTKLDLDEKNIYRFGMGFNSAQLGDGNVTNVVIKSRYALLDLKCNKLEIRLRQFLRKILKIVLNEINEQNGTDYKPSDVKFEFKREVMTNALDNAQIEQIEATTRQTDINTLISLVGTLDDETVIQRICDVLDVDYEDIKGKLPVEGVAGAMGTLTASQTEPIPNEETEETPEPVEGGTDEQEE